MIAPPCKIPGCKNEQAGTRFCKDHEAAWAKSPQGIRAYAFNVYSDFYQNLLKDWITQLLREAEDADVMDPDELDPERSW
jgi:hypothetical protein